MDHVLRRTRFLTLMSSVVGTELPTPTNLQSLHRFPQEPGLRRGGGHFVTVAFRWFLVQTVFQQKRVVTVALFVSV